MSLSNVAGTTYLLVLFTAPGAAIVMWARRPRRLGLPLFVISAVGTSIAYVMTASLLLLWFGWFGLLQVSLVAAVPVVSAMAFGGVRLGDWRLVDLDLRTSIAVGVVVLFVVLLGVLTPRWTFLVSPNMDAGNYETYGNHFWKTGSLFLDAEGLQEQGVPADWIRSRNTWLVEEEAGKAKPLYFFGFPALLGIAKAAYGNPAVSTFVVIGVASLNAALLVLLALRFLKSRVLATLVTGVAVVTPMFFYYSKQIMTEQLALFGVGWLLLLLLEEARRPGEGRAFFVIAGGAAVAIPVLTRIDAPVILMFVAAALAVLTLEGRAQRRRSPIAAATLFGLGGAAAAATALVSWQVTDLYLRSNSRLSLYLPFTESSALGDQPMHGAVGFVAAGAFVALGVMVRRRAGAAHEVASVPVGREQTAVANGTWRWSRVLVWVGVVAWIAFALWNLLLRHQGVPLEENHDAHNLVRLLRMASPAIVIGLLLAAPALLRERGIQRWLPLAGLAAVSLMVFRSSHSSPDIWWMRRYLPTLIPTFVMVTAAGVAWLCAQRDGVRRLTVSFVGTGLALAMLMQGLALRPLFRHEVNVRAPLAIRHVRSLIPEGVPLVALEADSTTRGMVNTLRSLRSGPTLLNVPLDEVERAVELVAPSEDFALISSDALPETVARELSAELVEEAVFPRQWTNQFDAIKADPRAAHHEDFFVYIRST